MKIIYRVDKNTFYHFIQEQSKSGQVQTRSYFSLRLEYLLDQFSHLYMSANKVQVPSVA